MRNGWNIREEYCTKKVNDKTPFFMGQEAFACGFVSIKINEETPQ